MDPLKSSIGIPLIAEKVRNTAKNYPSLSGKNGCIVIYIELLCDAAARWLGIGYDPNDIEQGAHIFSLKPGGSYTIKRRASDDPSCQNEYSISCLGMAFAKIASCKNNREKYGINRSYATIANTPLSENHTFNGIINRKGCICLTIRQITEEEERDYCTIYVAVSGGESSEDEQAALGAIPAIEEIFPKEANFVVY